MKYKGHIIFRVEGWYEVDNMIGTFTSVELAKQAIDNKGKEKS